MRQWKGTLSEREEEKPLAKRNEMITKSHAIVLRVPLVSKIATRA